MKATELQIGDWVSYYNIAQQVLEISDIDNEVYLSEAEVVDITEVKPITLKRFTLRTMALRLKTQKTQSLYIVMVMR